MTIGADLWTFVKSVSAPALLRQLTNPENSPPNTIDDTVGTSAASAAADIYYTRVGILLDTAADGPLELGREGTILLLEIRRGLAAEESSRRRGGWYADLRAWAAATAGGARNRVVPQTNSKLTPTVPGSDGRLVRPIFDDTRFRDELPRDPGGGATEEGF